MISKESEENTQQRTGARNVVLGRHELFRLRNNEGLGRAELLKRKLFLSSDTPTTTNHVIKVLRDSEEMISFQFDTFDLIMIT